MVDSAAVYAIATMDTKAAELQFVANSLRETGVVVRTVDVSTGSDPKESPDVTRAEVLSGSELPSGGTRGDAIAAMGSALGRYLSQELQANRVTGVIGIGGSGGTALITAAMRRLPIGLPKLMVSTVASGNTTPYVDCTDIIMMYSVVDIAGLNRLSEQILSNAAHAMAGMARHRTITSDRIAQRTLGLTMFGVTTPCVNAVRESLEAQGEDCLVFHATGTGGRAMENLVRAGMITGVLDITTTEVADEVVGGVFPAGPDRFESTVDQGIPFVLSVGALDMVNFGAIETIPARFKNRTLYQHNPQITLMRTTPDENREIAAWIATKLNRSVSGFTLLLPEKGVSILDAPGGPFEDTQANAALFETLDKLIEDRENRTIIRLPYHINDPEFSRALVDEFERLQGSF